MKNYKILSYLLLSLIIFTISCKDDSEIPAESQLVNNWIKGQMSTYYFWNNQMPNVNLNSFADPKDYFNRLLYKDDRFSWITNDAQKLISEMKGNAISMGFSPSFGKISGTENVFIVVQFVYENSPASEAGLKRGDIIIAINNTVLDTENYYTLYSGSSYSVTLGKYSNGGIESTNQKVQLTARKIEMDPVRYYNVIEHNNNKIGYLVYSDFISGENNRWVNRLKEVLTEIKGSGATELVVDLRFNPGGELKVAGFLASAIAPSEVLSDQSVLVKFLYNDMLNQHFLEKEGPESGNLIYKIPASTINMNLSRVVFLTSKRSASASELLLNGLEPYMDVFHIGEKTVGKCYGSLVLTDDNEPPRHQYAMMPLVFKYENADGFTDFFEGLIPDYYIDDNVFDTKPFGDTSDPMLMAALNFLSGELPGPARLKPIKLPFETLDDIHKLRKGNILWVD